MDGTGYAGVRGRARSHTDRAGLKVFESDHCLYRHGASPWGLERSPVGAGSPAKQALRWMAPATPVFAGMPAPTLTVQASRS
ncbi:hypothetical protein BL240_12965 [Pseudomonas putida]|uniref:Uncharacterized protein n=1 Tax=Pseudomonas putida TaxID=303 RepID=A0A1L5PQ72_PSEPU|nr:hypothetical protein BL240_12965 [Pseudomonas putida]